MNLGQYIEKFNAGNQAAFARAHGLSKTVVNRACSGKNVSVKKLREIISHTKGAVTVGGVFGDTPLETRSFRVEKDSFGPIEVPADR